MLLGISVTEDNNHNICELYHSITYVYYRAYKTFVYLLRGQLLFTKLNNHLPESHTVAIAQLPLFISH